MDTPSDEGFDIQAGLTWIYPTNYTVRDYQFNIIQQALYKNTLVSLPTGLGKTFIAAVVMFNFFRWYPTGKIIFMAPTRPLVKQQVDACYNITAIPKDVTAELTGTTQNLSRKEIWIENRVFFVTPQVLQNDLDKLVELASLIKCMVFDEAHRAKGNYAYCKVIEKLKQQNPVFRVLALSATPGNTIDDFRDVITNLMISHLELRTEESIDVRQYVFRRKLETVVVALGEKLEQIKSDYNEILEKYVRTLVRYKIIPGNCGNISKGRIFMIKNEYQNRGTRDSNYNEIMKTLNICMTLYHAYELLIKHGLRGFHSFFKEHKDKPLLRGNKAIARILNELSDYLESDLPNVDPLPDGSYPEVSSSIKFGHPKFYKLKEILMEHFNGNDNKTESSRVIVFFEYRDSVMEAFVVLLQARPVIRARVFLGQKGGITQRAQMNVIKSFREGVCNTLLSTSIGEEGLDVGEVDLIVCFDVSNKSPIRMVQRMGRTGRKREGRVVVLVTEGKEQQTLSECIAQKNALGNLSGWTKRLEGFFIESPRMVPNNINPKCMKMQITVRETTKKNTIKNMFRKTSRGSSASTNIPDNMEILVFDEKLKEPSMHFDRSTEDLTETQPFELNYSKFVENQRSLHGTKLVNPSDTSRLFVKLMKFADSRRFNLPSTQNLETGFKTLKQSDIRTLFGKVGNKHEGSASQDDFQMQVVLDYASSQEVVSTLKPVEHYRELFIELGNYLSIQLIAKKNCYICDEFFSCELFNKNTESRNGDGSDVLNELKNWIQPDFSIIGKLTFDKLENYKKKSEKCQEIIDDSLLELIEGNSFSNLSYEDKSFNFNPPKSFNMLLESFKISSTPAFEEKKTELNGNEFKKLLEFFKLTSIDGLFEDASTDVIDGVDGSPSKSPVLFSQKRSSGELKTLIMKARSFEGDPSRPSPNPSNTVVQIPKQPKPAFDLGINDFCDLSSFNLNEVQKSSQKIKLDYENSAQCETKNTSVPEEKDMSIEDICDISMFTSTQEFQSEVNENFTSTQKSESPQASCASKETITALTLRPRKSKEPSRNELNAHEKSTNFDNSTYFKTPEVKIKKSSCDKSTVLSSANSDDEFEETVFSSIKSTESNVNVKKKNRKKERCDFIQDEVEVFRGHITLSSDENSDADPDSYDESFVNDDTLNCENDSRAYDKYLLTARRSRKGAKFKIPEHLPPVSSEIFSQQNERNLDDTYINDSFCIPSDECDEMEEMSILELLEKQLEEKKRKKKCDEIRITKRIIIHESDSSD